MKFSELTWYNTRKEFIGSARAFAFVKFSHTTAVINDNGDGTYDMTMAMVEKDGVNRNVPAVSQKRLDLVDLCVHLLHADPCNKENLYKTPPPKLNP